MSNDYRKVCAEIIAAGEKATKPQKRYWEQPEYLPADKGGDAWGTIEPQDESTHDYLIIAANNADRLARFVLRVINEPHGGEPHDARLARLWEESK